MDIGWTEHQTGDGRKFYHHDETGTSSWEKPEALMSTEERANSTKWREFRIWDGRVFYHNKETKVSCWAMPPELRELRGESSGLDDRPLPETMAEKRRAFGELMKAQAVDSSWTWQMVDSATKEMPEAELPEAMKKQCFAELLSSVLKAPEAEVREKDRNAANALERLFEERFGRPEDLGTGYDEAAQILGEEEAWKLVKSEVRRDEVFQEVMERLEEKHRKARLERRTERIVRLQRLMATDLQLSRKRLRWEDAAAVLARRDELQEEGPPVEALRVWNSMLQLRPMSSRSPVASRNTRQRTAEADGGNHFAAGTEAA